MGWGLTEFLEKQFLKFKDIFTTFAPRDSIFMKVTAKPYFKKCRKCNKTYRYALKDIKQGEYGSFSNCTHCFTKNNHP